MSFDSTTRNRLASFVAKCRALLCGDFNSPGGEMARQLAHYGIQDTGDAFEVDTLTHLDEPGRELAHTLRELLAHKSANAPAAKVWKKFDPAVYDLIQEQGFTVLNRLCALRMAEERKILAFPCISAGLQSDGFQLYEYHSGKANPDITPELRYQHFLFSLFDELSLDLGSLFDRFSPQGLLFPSTQALADLLEEINHPDLAPLWAEDETIGWIYQYWNSKEERKAMRDASAAPRNSRELAVRNQFFTPRYVVEFLTDNTLGRIWYEMTKGQTRLAEQCRYLVRRPTEIFLGEGQDAPDPPEGDTEETLSQEELLKQPIHISHRPVKDPREIRLLDPACGSMHFGLYAFDLFEAIYEEAWDKGLCPALQEAYPEKTDYLRDVPRLIIEHNIHGVDIDPRAVQIAGLSLWLRAQKTWRDTPAAERPRVRRSNIVCAEPMPGSDAMLEDFLQTLDPPLLGELVKTVFDKMQLAGEAGTLLKIEEEIRTAIDDAKAKWEKLGAAERDLFSAEELNQTLRPGAQQKLTGVEKALTTDHRPLATDFFDTAEERIYAALRDYAESAEAGDYQRRLFAEDAAHGFAFIDLCRKHYDAVVMNPPFGDATKLVSKSIAAAMPICKKNLYIAFVVSCRDRLASNGRLGAITDATFIHQTRYEDFRRKLVADEYGLSCLTSNGWGVLDAFVETASFVIAPNQAREAFFCDLREHEDRREECLNTAITNTGLGKETEGALVANRALFSNLPKSVLAFWLPRPLTQAYRRPTISDQLVDPRCGLSSSDNTRFYKLRWEISPSSLAANDGWRFLANGGQPSPLFRQQTYVINYTNDGRAIKTRVKDLFGSESRTVINQPYYFRAGLTFGKRTESFSAQFLPGEQLFSNEGQAIFIKDTEHLWGILGFLNSSTVVYLLNSLAGQHKEAGYVATLPEPPASFLENPEVVSLLKRNFDTVSQLGSIVPETQYFCSPFSTDWCNDSTSVFSLSTEVYDRAEEFRDSFIKIDEILLHTLGIEDPKTLPFESREWDLFGVCFECGAEQSQETRLIDTLGYLIGASLGRWDIRYATGERQSPELPDPFDPLPVCPPGMLQNADGLPAAPSDVPDDYPLPITWPGILVSDPGHPEDIVARVRDALTVIWSDRSAAIEQEACEILGVRTLRDYFAEKKSGGKFFKDHLKRYSKSRRQAPIYWPLSTESGTYTLWIYYHRLDSDTLFACITQFIEPKQESVAKTFTSLSAKKGRTNAEDKELEAAQLLIAELSTFKESLLEIAKTWQPNLNDGVQITAAPLWKHFRLKAWQKKLKDTWTKLEKGEYDWAHLAHSTWPDRVIPKCLTDRSLAIAHGHDEALWESYTNDRGKEQWRLKKDATETVEKLVQQHSK